MVLPSLEVKVPLSSSRTTSSFGSSRSSSRVATGEDRRPPLSAERPACAARPHCIVERSRRLRFSLRLRRGKHARDRPLQVAASSAVDSILDNSRLKGAVGVRKPVIRVQYKDSVRGSFLAELEAEGRVGSRQGGLIAILLRQSDEITLFCFIKSPIFDIMELETVIASIDYLPPTAKILPKLQKVLRDEESGVEEIAALIKVDASLTAEIIRIRNSAYFGSPTQSRNIHEAISRLGYSKIYRTVSLIVVKEILGNALPVYQLKQGELWEQSILTATMMEGLANEIGEDSDTAYTTGLVHNLGKIPIDRILTKDAEDNYH